SPSPGHSSRDSSLASPSSSSPLRLQSRPQSPIHPPPCSVPTHSTSTQSPFPHLPHSPSHYPCPQDTYSLPLSPPTPAAQPPRSKQTLPPFPLHSSPSHNPTATRFFPTPPSSPSSPHDSQQAVLARLRRASRQVHPRTHPRVRGRGSDSGVRSVLCTAG